VTEYAQQARSVKAGKKSVLGFFVGKVMKQTRGSADPRLVSEILEALISELE
jgi:aspartyl-tRNA(Asn)/glutamyl-tRNA(Gln) amidotransferase subunit B